MRSLSSPMMRPLSISVSLSDSSPSLFSRILLSRPLPKSLFPNFRIHPKLYINPSRSHLLIRSCSSITAKPSSELRRNRTISSEPDEKLRALRELFTKPEIGIDAYIIPSQDAHQSEFIAECYMRRAYISGFTGSAGTAVVTKEKAALWTDGRYFLQVREEFTIRSLFWCYTWDILFCAAHMLKICFPGPSFVKSSF
uniref:Uncharacterized protein MANES_09G167500 n=1 Tax=Rhizophora mucronata TaxID=61149 RepID=A0A2P2KSP7_RHIMU